MEQFLGACRRCSHSNSNHATKRGRALHVFYCLGQLVRSIAYVQHDDSFFVRAHTVYKRVFNKCATARRAKTFFGHQNSCFLRAVDRWLQRSLQNMVCVSSSNRHAKLQRTRAAYSCKWDFHVASRADADATPPAEVVRGATKRRTRGLCLEERRRRRSWSSTPR